MFRLCGDHASSVDLFDLIMRHRGPRPQDEGAQFPTEIHEYVHYVQLVATATGFHHVVRLDRFFLDLEAVLAARAAPRLPIMEHLDEVAQTMPAEAERLAGFVQDLQDAWRFEIPVPPSGDRPISLAGVTLEIDEDALEIRYGDLLRVPVGLRAVAEMMARCAEYSAREMRFVHRAGVSEDMPLAQLRAHLAQRGLHHVPHVYPQFFGPSAVVYDFPLFFANREARIERRSDFTAYTLLCGWIAFMNDPGFPDRPASTSAPSVCRSFLRMLKKGPELAPALIGEPMSRLGEGKRVRFSALDTADAIAEACGERPLSRGIALVERLLAVARDTLGPSEEGALPESPTWWFARDGLTILERYKPHPAAFLFPTYAFGPREKPTQLPLPLVLWSDTRIRGEGGVSRSLSQIARAVIKEAAFSHVPGGPPQACPYGEDCVDAIDDAPLQDFVKTVRARHVDRTASSQAA